MPLRIDLGDVDTEELDAAADYIDKLVEALEEIAGDPVGISSYQADIAKAALGHSIPQDTEVGK